MKSIYNILFIFAIAGSLVSCKNDRKPNYQFMPNMYYPVSYEAYGEYDIFPGGQSAMLPVENTIPRGWAPYEYENTTEGLEEARLNLKNPLTITEENLAEGKKLYSYYCSVCHGDKGDGQGILVQREKFLGVPSYADPGRQITEGSIYHVQVYGLNAMGSFLQQTSETERWQIAMHVLNLKADLEGTPKLVPASLTEESHMGMVSEMETETEVETTLETDTQEETESEE
jgi:mono/diheme cytochrome c family protein